MSDSSRPHGLQPTRFLCPWDFPGKSTGVGCHYLLWKKTYRWLTNTWKDAQHHSFTHFIPFFLQQLFTEYLPRANRVSIRPHSSTLAWRIAWTEEPGRLHAVHGVAKSRTRLSDFIFTFHFHALEKEMAAHSSVLAWKVPGTVGPGGLPSMESHRVGHEWSDLAAAAAAALLVLYQVLFSP